MASERAPVSRHSQHNLKEVTWSTLSPCLRPQFDSMFGYLVSTCNSIYTTTTGEWNPRKSHFTTSVVNCGVCNILFNSGAMLLPIIFYLGALFQCKS